MRSTRRSTRCCSRPRSSKAGSTSRAPTRSSSTAPTANLVKLIEVKQQAIAANIAKIDVGARGTLVTFHKDDFPDPAGLLAYVDRLQGTAKLRPDMKLVINRDWGSPESRLNGLLQLTKGLSGIVRKAEKREKAAA